jgi:hypothetical protein
MATISIRPAEDPITEDDAFIRRAVASASTPALMMSLIHVSGDRSLLDGEIRPRTAVLNEIQSGMTDAERAAIVELSEEVEALRDELSMVDASPALRARVGEAREPYRALLRDVRERLRATRAWVEASLAADEPPGAAVSVSHQRENSFPARRRHGRAIKLICLSRGICEASRVSGNASAVEKEL